MGDRYASSIAELEENLCNDIRNALAGIVSLIRKESKNKDTPIRKRSTPAHAMISLPTLVAYLTDCTGWQNTYTSWYQDNARAGSRLLLREPVKWQGAVKPDISMDANRPINPPSIYFTTTLTARIVAMVLLRNAGSVAVLCFRPDTTDLYLTPVGHHTSGNGIAFPDAAAWRPWPSTDNDTP